MLCDEHFLACIIPLSDAVESSARPAELDQIKATGKSRIQAVYEDIHRNYKLWNKDYKNPFVDGLFAEELGGIQPQSATFKDGDAIMSPVRSTVLKVGNALKNHRQSGHHSTGNDRLQEIKNTYMSPKGKNVDMSYFCAFLMLENIDFKLEADA